MIRNCIGFVPKNSEPQPDYYKRCFDMWCAVFLTDDDQEYHLQLERDPWGWQYGNEYAKGVQVLFQAETHRTQLTETLPTIKAGLRAMAQILENHAISQTPRLVITCDNYVNHVSTMC